jgi:predicted Zn-dependent protease
MLMVLLAASAITSNSPAHAAELADAQELLRSGRYDECIDLATEALGNRIGSEDWRLLKIRAEMAQGQYAAALATTEQAIEDFPRSIRLRLEAHEVYLHNRRAALAGVQWDTIQQLVRRDPRRYTTPADRLVLGEYFLRLGADPKQVLELFYDPIVDQLPEFAEAHFASARLALDKHDPGLAAEVLATAPESAHDDPEYHYLLARAFASDDPTHAAAALEQALAVNPRHSDSLLLMAEMQIDREQYDPAQQTLARVRETHATHPIAWALTAVLGHLRAGSLERERVAADDAREHALRSWPDNPAVDHTIGRKLSEKYRFAEGAAYQRQALALDPQYLPARMQLAQDLLRLGKEDEGWQLVQDVFAQDGYNVVAHNLVSLHDSFPKYRVLTTDAFRIRMEAREAALYGNRVIALVERAKQTLCKKYDVTLTEPVNIEIFPQQKDFAVRTFGLPGADGFLGVCFGNVITANSPAALGSATSNWEAVLWHEFCHVVTLRKSRNRMPRWLSEGISVYEERLENSTWGQTMTPQYRRLVLAGELPPLSQLSSSFLAPKSPLHLQLAYYQSALAVEFLIARRGLEAVNLVLEDLGRGVPIDLTLAERIGPLERLDLQFQAYVEQVAKNLAPGLNWDEIEPPSGATIAELQAWLEEHPDHFGGLMRYAESLLEAREWEPALVPALRLRELFPEYVGPGNAYELIARAQRGRGDAVQEREILAAWSSRSADASQAYLRLMQLDRDAEDWSAVVAHAEQQLAVNPLSPVPYRYLAEAAEQLGDSARAIAANRALLEFDTSDRSRVHYQLARLLRDTGKADAARRQVLMSIEEAPRYRAAHRLLLELVPDEVSQPPEEAKQLAEKEPSEPSESSELPESSGASAALEPTQDLQGPEEPQQADEP